MSSRFDSSISTLGDENQAKEQKLGSKRVYGCYL